MENLSLEFPKYEQNRKELKKLLNGTKRIVGDFKKNDVFDEDILNELLPSSKLNDIEEVIGNDPTLVVLGQNNKSKTQFVNNFLNTDALQVTNEKLRWIKFEFSEIDNVRLLNNSNVTLGRNLKRKAKSWDAATLSDLAKSKNDDSLHPVVVEAKLNNYYLRYISILVTSSDKPVDILIKKHFKILPLFIYNLDEDPLSEENMEELVKLKEAYPQSQFLFVSSEFKLSFFKKNELTESSQHAVQGQMIINSDLDETVDEFKSLKNEILCKIWKKQLLSIGFLNTHESNSNKFNNLVTFTNYTEQSKLLLDFVQSCLKQYLLEAVSTLSELHSNGLRNVIFSAFDKAREIEITPKRLQYVQKMENELQANLIKISNEKQEELTFIIGKVIEDMKITVNPQDIPIENNNIQDASEIEKFTLNQLEERIAHDFVASINCLRKSFIGTLERCLAKLEEGYTNENNVSASCILKQIFTVAYNIDLTGITSLLTLKPLPQAWSPPTSFDTSWRDRVFFDVLHSLSPPKLARAISTQIRNKIKLCHEQFKVAFHSLENHLNKKLKQVEGHKFIIRKSYAPKLARLGLECSSLVDLIRNGLPDLQKEIGRGSFGVVFSCKKWGNENHSYAVKSVIPTDERQWNDLSMEFYYTKSIPDHERIVKLRGSVIEKSDCLPKILLITDRMAMDLYRGIRSGLSHLERIQIAIDVLEGIRYLHSLGLIHRDIKLNNVLLDNKKRAKLTDFGFCVTEAMMCGSVVGTPIHMAPELLTGIYDCSVDIYAFGILFWYLCSGNIMLPSAYQQFYHKEQLWDNVKKGLRPERLTSFSDECWDLMEQCWASEPSQRPHLGAILPVLESIHSKNSSNECDPNLNINCADILHDRKNQRGRISKTTPVQSVLSVFRNFTRNASCFY